MAVANTTEGAPVWWKEVVIHSDGACEGNPGPGGWAAVLQYGPQCKEIAGGELATTNNRMELRAAIEALGSLRGFCEVALHTDSEYVRQGISTWIRGWKRRAWLTVDERPVKNEDLWRRLDALNTRHRVTWHWVRGHTGHPLNERCDLLAREAIGRLRTQHSKAEFAAALSAFRRQQTESETRSP